MGCSAQDLEDLARLNADGNKASSTTIAAVFAALSNPARIDIIRHVAQHERCGCKDITNVLPLAQSTVSQHLKVLIEAGIIVCETVPPRSCYSVNEHLMRSVAAATGAFVDSCCQTKPCNKTGLALRSESLV